MSRTCKNCQRSFEPYREDRECYNQNCHNGIEERWYDWDFDEPTTRECSDCKGTGSVNVLVDDFCDESCEEDFYFDLFESK